MIGRCRSCNADVIWAEMATTRSRMPIDPEPAPDGNVVLVFSKLEDEPPTAFVLGGEKLRAARVSQRLYRSHFATCPHAARWRRPHTTKEVSSL